MSNLSPAPTQPSSDAATAVQAPPVVSRFDHFGGHYSVMVEGVEVARWAPSSDWSDYATEISERPGWTYAWISTDGKGA